MSNLENSNGADAKEARGQRAPQQPSASGERPMPTKLKATREQGRATSEELLCKFSEEYAADPCLATLDALVARYKHGRPKLDPAIEGYAKVLRKLLQAKQQDSD